MRLRSFGRELLRLPLLRGLRPRLRRVLAVSEPAGRVSIKHRPMAVHRPAAVQHSSSGADAAGQRPLSVLSANLWHDWPRHRRLLARMEDFASLVEDEGVDVVLLQEVARTPDLQVDEWLAERLGMAYVYSRANGHAAIDFEEGLAVFSRFPLKRVYLRQLDRVCNPFTRRLALGASVETPHGDLLAFSVHLGLSPRQNAAQLAHLSGWVRELGGDQPVLLGGDFNAHETTPQIRRTQAAWLDTFRHLHPLGDGVTHELRWPWGGVARRQRLDYIFLRRGQARWKVLETRHLHVPEAPHSDHRAVLTRLASSSQHDTDVSCGSRGQAVW